MSCLLVGPIMHFDLFFPFLKPIEWNINSHHWIFFKAKNSQDLQFILKNKATLLIFYVTVKGVLFEVTHLFWVEFSRKTLKKCIFRRAFRRSA